MHCLNNLSIRNTAVGKALTSKIVPRRGARLEITSGPKGKLRKVLPQIPGYQLPNGIFLFRKTLCDDKAFKEFPSPTCKSSTSRTTRF